MIKTPLSAAIGGAFWTPSATILGSTSKTFNQLIKSLFANGEQGFAYDPNDLSTMYQDAAGTVPVTGAGQLVGLLLDKSKGLVLGSELVTNGDFSNGLTGWHVQNGTAVIVNGAARITATSTAQPQLYMPTAFLAGKSVEISVDFMNRTSGTGVFVGIYSEVTGTIASVISNNTAGTIKLKAIIPLGFSGGLYCRLNSPTAGSYVDFDNVSIKELAGNHAYQTQAAMRPLLQRNATTGAYYLAFDGSDDFLVTNSIDFTSTDKISLFVGVRKLSDFTAFPLIVETGDNATVLGSFHLYANASTTRRGYAFAATGATQVWRSMAGDYASPDSAVITAFPNLSAAGSLAVKLRRNGVNQTLVGGGGAVTGGGNFGNLPLYIGRRAGASLPFNGHIYGLIGVGKLASDTETASIEKELAKRAGVTLSV